MTEEKKVNINYKDADTLKGFISENGKILSSRYTRLNAKEQRKLTKCQPTSRRLRRPGAGAQTEPSSQSAYSPAGRRPPPTSWGPGRSRPEGECEK